MSCHQLVSVSSEAFVFYLGILLYFLAVVAVQVKEEILDDPLMASEALPSPQLPVSVSCLKDEDIELEFPTGAEPVSCFKDEAMEVAAPAGSVLLGSFKDENVEPDTPSNPMLLSCLKDEDVD